ncbi:hypothetical protein MMPV_007773 [Pyropia vietnamensis]
MATAGSTSAAATPAMEAATGLLTAIAAAGGTVSPALTVAPSSTAPGRAVLVASSAIGGAGRTPLLQLPLSLVWTPESAAATLPPLPDSPLLDDYALLSLALIHARANPAHVGPVAASYVAGLPDAAALDVPLLWADTELDRLSGSALRVAAARMKAEVAAEWVALDAKVLAPARDAFPADVYTADAYAWSAAVVVERGLTLPDYPLVLAPAVDLATGVVPAGNDGGSGGGGGGTAAPGMVELVGTGLFGRNKVLQLSAPVDGVPTGATVAGVSAAAATEGRSFRDYFLETGAVVATAPATDADGGGVVGLSFGLSPDDNYYDDKLDILETYAYPEEAADGDEDEDGEVRVFPLAAAPAGADDDDDKAYDSEADADDGSGGLTSWTRESWTPPPDLMPFLRLVMLNGGDVFLLEAVFRREVWGFMSYPVSEQNEAAAIDAILAACAAALDGYTAPSLSADDEDGGAGVDGPTTARRKALARRLVGVETAALRACVAYFTRERATLDSLEYYQERRLRELNLLRPVDPSEIVDSESGGRAAAAFDEYY